MKFSNQRIVLLGGALLGSLAGVAMALAQAGPGPSGEIPPLFGPDNPAPSSEVTYPQISQELWGRSFDLNQVFARIGGLQPVCGGECLIDDSPEELAHLLEVGCNSIDKIQFDAHDQKADSELTALSGEARQSCAAGLARLSSFGKPSSSNQGWRDAAKAWNSALSDKLTAARPVIDRLLAAAQQAGRE